MRLKFDRREVLVSSCLVTSNSYISWGCLDLRAREHLHLGGNRFAHDDATSASGKLLVIAELGAALVCVLGSIVSDDDLMGRDHRPTIPLLLVGNVHEAIICNLGLRALHLLRVDILNLLWWDSRHNPLI